MIKKLSIKGFKSIRQLDLDCRRVNVFIGEPNTGKTNILEALSLWSSETISELKKVLRLNRISDISSEQDIQGISIVKYNNLEAKISFHPPLAGAASFQYGDGSNEPTVYAVREDSGDVDLISGPSDLPDRLSVSYYLFDGHSETNLGTEDASRLAPPFGCNLAELLGENKRARQDAATFFTDGRHRLTVDRSNRSVLMAREEDGTLVALPYSSCSETLRRMVFYQLALNTNHNAVLIFDEPEAHAFPPYTKRMAENIAADDHGNQFFLTTHSPYMLDSLLSKTPASELNVVLCRMENFETKAHPLDEKQIGKLMEWSMDAFFNFDRLLDEKE